MKLSGLESLTITPESLFSGLTTDFGLRWNLELGDSLAPKEIAPEEPAFDQPAPTSGLAEDETITDQE